jgi:hypothetical protein
MTARPSANNLSVLQLLALLLLALLLLVLVLLVLLLPLPAASPLGPVHSRPGPLRGHVCRLAAGHWLSAPAGAQLIRSQLD